MKDDRCVRFLQWALPKMQMRWPGFRKVRRQVCKRIDRRIKALGLTDIDAYQDFINTHAEEWATLDSLCRITISRFSRDTGVSGEEPYTLAILWYTKVQPRFPDMKLHVTATDSDAQMLKRAREARYEFASLKDLPEDLRDRVFTRQDDTYYLHADYKRDVTFLEQDIRKAQPEGNFDLVLCRNLVFTYFDDKLQAELLSRIIDSMANDAALLIGIHEHLPECTEYLEPWFKRQRIYRKTTDDQ
jgi:chemotaxis protein methyltransferase CheR